MWKDFFYFSRIERQGIFVLAILISIVIATGFLLPLYKDPDQLVRDENFEEEYNAFINSLKEKSRNSKTTVSTRSRKTYTDFPSSYTKKKPQEQASIPTVSEERTQYTKVFKYPAGTIISLNQADTTALKKIPGIGSYTAQKIVGYRKKLGGFYHIEQLREINLNAEEFAPWFSIDSEETTRINLNKISAERLKAHPYFNFYQAKAIIEYRKKKGKLRSLNQLSFYEEFTEEDLVRMNYYVRFE